MTGLAMTAAKLPLPLNGPLNLTAPLTLLFSVFLSATGLHAQDPFPFPQLPDSIATRVVELHNAPTTTRFSGEASISAGTTVDGDVALLGGRLVIAGRIQGSVVVINGDLAFEPGSAVAGDVFIVGGRVEGLDLTAIGGRFQRHPTPLRYRQHADGTIDIAPPARDALSAGRDFPFGRTDLLVAARNGYNRAEGLPIQFGPRFRFGDSNPTYLDGFLIFRTATGLDPIAVDRLGYAVRLEQAIGGRNTLRLGGRLYSEVLPIESVGLSDRENSFATFFLRDDHRDAWEVDGWSAYVRWAPPGGATDLTLEFADEHHRSVAPADTWTLFGDDEWRPNPVVAEGELRTVRVRLTHDTRNEEADPSAGWLVRAAVEQGAGGDLATPIGVTGVGPGIFQTQDQDDFTTGTLDFRRYARLAPYAQIAFRFYAAGSIDGGALPPQRQRTLGGVGSLPAYDLFQFDCAARAERVELRDRPFFPHYGCDRAVLLQIEYQAGFPFIRRLGRSLGLAIDLGQQVRWAAFFDAGRAWTEPGALDGRGRGMSGLAADLGLGIRIGQLGFYWAVPLTDDGSGIDFFVRLGRRL